MAVKHQEKPQGKGRDTGIFPPCRRAPGILPGYDSVAGSSLKSRKQHIKHPYIQQDTLSLPRKPCIKPVKGHRYQRGKLGRMPLINEYQISGSES